MKSLTKTCTKCQKTKSITEFYKVKRKRKNKSGMKEYEIVREKCKECSKNYAQARRDLRYYLPLLYGITEEEYDKMREQQKYSCAICGIHEDVWFSERQRRLYVDHDHVTGKVRGLLCGNCNTGLGNFKDSKENLKKAMSYLNDSLS